MHPEPTRVKVKAFRRELACLMDASFVKPIAIWRNGRPRCVVISQIEFDRVKHLLYRQEDESNAA